MVKTLNPVLETLEGRTGRIATILDEHKGEQISVMDLRGISDFADAFVIVTARSTTHMQALIHHVETKLREEGLRPLARPESIGPQSDTRWAVLDYADVIVHVFTTESRAYYDLESLWGDAQPMAWQQTALA